MTNTIKAARKSSHFFKLALGSAAIALVAVIVMVIAYFHDSSEVEPKVGQSINVPSFIATDATKTSVTNKDRPISTQAGKTKPNNSELNKRPQTSLSPNEAGIEFDAQALAIALSTAGGKALRDKLTEFWRQCRSINVCDARLLALYAHLSREDYQMIAHYHALNSERDALMGMESVSHALSLYDKVARVKLIDQQIWGVNAERLYRDLYQMYDERLSASELYDIHDADEYLAQFDKLQQAFSRNRADRGEKVIGEQQYEQALTYLPEYMPAAQKQRVKEVLAKRYLDEQQMAEIRVRENQVQAQEVQVKNYQLALQELQSRLKNERRTIHASLTESEWLTYYQNQIHEFRVSFFNG